MCYTTMHVKLTTEKHAEHVKQQVILCSSFIEGFKPPDFFFALFPSLYPGGWNVPVLLQYLTGLNVQRMHLRKNRQKKTRSP